MAPLPHWHWLTWGMSEFFLLEPIDHNKKVSKCVPASFAAAYLRGMSKILGNKQERLAANCSLFSLFTCNAAIMVVAR